MDGPTRRCAGGAAALDPMPKTAPTESIRFCARSALNMCCAPVGPFCELPGARRNHPWGIILAPRELQRPSKVQEFDEAVSWDKKELSCASGLFAQLRCREPTRSLWSFSQPQALGLLKLAAFDLHLPYSTMSLYMFRHGGASHDALTQARTIEQIKQRGRWLSADVGAPAALRPFRNPCQRSTSSLMREA